MSEPATEPVAEGFRLSLSGWTGEAETEDLEPALLLASLPDERTDEDTFEANLRRGDIDLAKAVEVDRALLRVDGVDR